jgi:hypothetical protein
MRVAAKQVGVVAAVAMLAAGAWIGSTAERQPASPPQGAGKAEIFCENLSAGQLCLHGTIDVLKLEAARQAKWREAGRRYNQAVEAATKQFLGEVKELLSPEDYARVAQWFDKSVNAYLNQRLLATAGSR